MNEIAFNKEKDLDLVVFSRHSEKSRSSVDSSVDDPSSQQNWLPVSAQITAASAQLSSGLWPLQTFLPNQSGILAWARVWMRL